METSFDPEGQGKSSIAPPFSKRGSNKDEREMTCSIFFYASLCIKATLKKLKRCVTHIATLYILSILKIWLKIN